VFWIHSVHAQWYACNPLATTRRMDCYNEG
jgi:hypothetical protein